MDGASCIAVLIIASLRRGVHILQAPWLIAAERVCGRERVGNRLCWGRKCEDYGFIIYVCMYVCMYIRICITHDLHAGYIHLAMCRLIVNIAVDEGRFGDDGGAW